ncbi:phospholipase activating protein [Vairimorpha ceranae]|uniref:Phospholipase activating protein n=1 Tax=Vairimorpha ceranae TaxID=40302 RepID=A0A0F9YPI9_9MICR|nr:phospholipase activating protein [Vairimorpha ceranae]KAF5140575.1 hypothetical protein G9O61_00g013800 [Vairimorpha ceranae]KKO74562.1 phospholipase activating protein [Vairimorpha ceranae]
MLEIQNMINCSTKDLKDVIVTDKYIITVGREELIFIYDKNNTLIKKLNPDSGNVNSVVFDKNLIYVGCQSGAINIFDIKTSEKSVLYGHTGNVCCLKIRNNILLSGSWDHSLKMWDINKKIILSSIDHPGTVWCVSFIDDNRFVTGCADKVLRIYKNNYLEMTMTLHNFCIRSVCVRNNFIYSVDNEGTLLKTSLAGDLLSHNSFKDFMYCVILYGENLLCCGENGKIYILNNNLHIIDEISVPCTSCWKAFLHENILYVCGSDGTLYVFQDKKSDEDIKEKFNKIKEQRGGIKEFTSDGQKYKIIDNIVYQWLDDSWVQIGEQGESYDYSFNVELEGKYFTLSFNKKDNIYDVAENFLKVNKLNYEYKDEIIEYIRKNFKQDNFKTYESINSEGVKRTLASFNNIKYIFINLNKINKEHGEFLEKELLWLLQNNMRFVALDLYRYFTVHGFNFDLTFLMRFAAKDRKESLAFTRLITVLYCDPPFNLESLFPVIQKLRDIGYLNDSDLDDYYNNRSVRNQLQL